MADFHTKHGSFMAIPFTLTNATTGLSNSDLVFSGGATTLAVMPQAGSIVGITANCAAITAGTVTLKPHRASTEYTDAGTPAPVLSSAQDTNGTYATVRPSALTFVAGDTLGISATTTTTLDPTNTLDVDALLWIQLDPE